MVKEMEEAAAEQEGSRSSKLWRFRGLLESNASKLVPPQPCPKILLPLLVQPGRWRFDISKIETNKDVGLLKGSWRP
ncbi:hypothetical protein AAHA92_27098 [Salvia divinorum]|uniref:Uncharacterized protein n=1 Tax=Salvia divinorum TaxID=28513 RepID=A0ABD1G2K4_SALDI